MVIPPPPSPDAELLEACAAFDALEEAYIEASAVWGLPGTPEDVAGDLECDRLAAAQEPLVDRMHGLRATSIEGHRARARSLALWDAELMKEGPGDTRQCLTAAIVRDLLA